MREHSLGNDDTSQNLAQVRDPVHTGLDLDTHPSPVAMFAVVRVGFIASTLVRRLLAVGHTVHAADIAPAMPRMDALQALPGGKERLKPFQVPPST